MQKVENLIPFHKKAIIARDLLNSPARLKLVTSEKGLNNVIRYINLSRPQLALSGYFGFFNFRLIQIFGNTENYYLKGLKPEQRIKAFKNLLQLPIPCIIVTTGHHLDQAIINLAEQKSIPVFRTECNTTKTILLLSEYLEDQFASQIVVHGSFVDVFGVGILFTGRSGIGKSEISLDLIERGHRIVADDVVMLTKKRESILMGTGTNMTQHFMEIRGLGIIDIRQMFGIRAIRFQKRLEIVVELEDWKEPDKYTRTGLDEQHIRIMDIKVPRVKLPIFPGKNITVIAESISMNYLLRTYGYDSASVFSNRLKSHIANASKSPFEDRRNIQYFLSDDE